MFELLLPDQLAWNKQLLIGIVCLGILYTFLLNRLMNIKLFWKQFFLFFLGLGLFYVTVGSPFSTISHFSFSLHMIQMSILYFIIPPLILLGIPSRMFDHLFRLTNTKCHISQSKIPLYAFAVLFLIYHLPIVLNVLSQNVNLQNGYLFFLFILSFGMWWPIISPTPKQQLNKKQRKDYTFLSGLILMPACMLFILTAFIDGSNNPFLNQITAHLCISPQSSAFHILPPPFNTKIDQVMSGIFMLGLHKIGLVITLKVRNKVI